MFLNKQRDKDINRIETIVGPETDLEGNIQTKMSLRVDGRVKGELRAQNVIIGEFGVVVGDVTAEKVIVGGKIKGNIVAQAMIELLPKAEVLGDLKTDKLIIADGAHFEGNCQMQKSSQVIELKPELMESMANGPKQLKVVGGGKH